MRGKIVKTLLFVICFSATYFLPEFVKAADDTRPVGSLLISEVYYNPIQAGTDTKYEWVELYNNTDEPVDIINWSLKDNMDSVIISNISYVVEPDSFLVIAAYKEFFLINFPDVDLGAKVIYLEHVIGNGLSNSNDTLTILDGDKNIINEVIWNSTDYKDLVIDDGQSIERAPIDGQFIMNIKPSPGSGPLPIVEPEEIKTEDIIVDIAIAREDQDGDKTTVSGIVTVLPGVLSTQYFYIEDKTGGMQVYNYHKLFPILKLGDKILISGELSSVSGERRIKIADITNIRILENVAEIIPVRVEVSEISEKYEGEYIKITGLVIETSGDNFVVGTKNSDEKIKVNIRDSANIDKPKMRKGDKVEIAGIVSEYKGEYRILPTKQEDVKVLTSDHLPMAGPSEILSLIFGTIIYTLWILFQKVRKRRLAWVPNWQQI